MNLYKYIKAHNELNPKLWNGFVLDKEVEEKIQTIVNEFVKFVNSNGLDINVVDVNVLGSNASYNYNPDSDIDAHIKAIFEVEGYKKEDLNKLYFQYSKMFNQIYAPTIKGIPVEIYVEDYQDETNVSEGVYSLTYGWIRKPKKEELKINSKEINAMYDNFMEDFEIYKEKISFGTIDEKIEETEKMIDKIYSFRKQNLGVGKEYGSGNILFKELRAEGYLTFLKELLVKLKTSKMSLKDAIINADKKYEMYSKKNNTDIYKYMYGKNGYYNTSRSQTFEISHKGEDPINVDEWFKDFVEWFENETHSKFRF